MAKEVDVAVRFLLNHRGDRYKFVRYRKEERLRDSQQSPFRWTSSGGDRGDRVIWRPVRDTCAEKRVRGRPWFYSGVSSGLDSTG